jgi:phage tail-like protein
MSEVITYQLHISGPDAPPMVAIPPGGISIGRDAHSNDLVLSHPMISREHARIECSLTGCQIIDRNSANGTKVNGEKLVPNIAVSLMPGSVISISPFTLILQPVSAAQELAPGIKLNGADMADAAATPEKTSQDSDALHLVDAAGPLPPDSPGKEDLPLPFSGDQSGPVDMFTESTRLLHYLPAIYHTGFLSRFLALFESIWTPIEWTVDNFDLYLDPGTAPTDFLPWLTQWFEIIFDATWNERQRRIFLKEAHQLYALRGTRLSLSRTLKIYTGCEPQIIDLVKDQEAFTFSVILPVTAQDVDKGLVEAIINACKPAHTTYTLVYKGDQDEETNRHIIRPL